MSNNLINILFREAIGYDVLTRFGEPRKIDNYPPHNIIKQGDVYTLTLAVAGFGRDNLEVSVDAGHLRVKGDFKDENIVADDEILHRGLAFRSFDRSWKLGEYVEVTNVALADGLLTIALEQKIPDEQKARKIDIQ
jgi:molecular chaperone IbpA